MADDAGAKLAEIVDRLNLLCSPLRTGRRLRRR